MAHSVGGTIFTIFADNTPYKQGMLEAKDIRKKVSDAISAFDKKEETSAKKVEEANAKRIAKQIELDNAVKKGESAKAISKLRDELAKLTAAEEKAVSDSKKLNNQRRESYKRLQQDIKQAADTAKATSGASEALGALKGNLLGLVSVAGFKAFVDKLDNLGKRANDIGLTASQLQEFEHQAKLAGVSTGALDGAVKAFNRNVSLASMGTGEAKTALEAMGISLTNANGSTKTQSELLKETSKWFADNAGNAENAGYAARIFGESGVELLRIFEQGKDVVDGVFNAKGIDDAAAAAARFNDALENVQNVGVKVGSRIVEGWSHVIDFFTNDIFNGIGDAAYERQLDKINATAKAEAKKRQLELKKLATEQAKAEEEKAKKIADIYKKLEEADKEYADSKLSNVDKVLNYQNEINLLTTQLNELEEAGKIDADYEKLYQKRLKLIKAVDTAEAAIVKEREAKAKEDLAKQKEEEKEAFAALEAEAKKEDAIRKKAEEQAKAYKEFLKEHETQKQIASAMYKGNKELADKIKQEAEAQKLAEKYNISVKEANRLLEEQKKIKDITDGKTTQYTDEEKKKAQEILDRGKKGSVGKKTLEDAQAIIDGKEIKNNTAMFKGFGGSKGNKRSNKVNTQQRELNDNRPVDTTNKQPDKAEKVKDDFYKNLTETLTMLKDKLEAIKIASQTTAKKISDTTNNN